MSKHYYKIVYLIAFLIIVFALSLSYFEGSEQPAPTEAQTAEEPIVYATEEVNEPIVEEPKEIITPVEIIEQKKEQKEVIIEIKRNYFDPSEIKIEQGTKVTWINKDSLPHKIVALNRAFYGTRMLEGDSYSFNFTDLGVYHYFDGVFPGASRGKVTVVREGFLNIDITGYAVAKLKKPENAWSTLIFAILISGWGIYLYTVYRKK